MAWRVHRLIRGEGQATVERIDTINKSRVMRECHCFAPLL
jgi:hypothetical protein